MADGKAQRTKPRQRLDRGLIRRLNTIALSLIVALCLGVILSLVFDVQKRLDALTRASSDSVQWALAQLQVEALLLRESLGAPDADLADVRKRIDIFYSRVSIFDNSILYAELRSRPAFDTSLKVLDDFLIRTLPLVDGPDDALRRVLPQLHLATATLRDAVRTMSLTGLEYFSIESDMQRGEVARTLRRVAGLTAMLIVALSILATVLLRLYQRSRTQAVENLLTTARLETIVATSVDAIVVVNRRGRVLEFNPAAEAIFGYDRHEAFGEQVTDLIFPPDSIPDTISAIETQLINPASGSSGKPRIELEAVRKDRSRFPVELSVASAANAEGEIFVAFLRDISDRLQAERDLTEARDQALKGEKAKAEFIAVMSHEMRTPLNGLLGSVEILGSTRLDSAQREIVEVIETSGQVLLHHVNSVLDISSAESGAIRPDRTPFILEALVREVLANQSGLAAAAGNQITLVAVTEPAGRVTGDPARLRQILLNLVGNAVKFTRNGTITVEIETEPAQTDLQIVEVRVIDNGIGIKEADQARVFDDFVTLDSSYGREAGGTGLGLGITRRLVQALGGTIGMESEEGQGSLFWVRLPFGNDLIQIAPAVAPPNIGQSVAPPKPLSILIIEDDSLQAAEIAGHLEAAGFRTARAHDGEHGLERARALQPVAITLDIVMPNMDGWAFLEEHDRDENLRKIPVIVVSVSADLKGRTHHDLTPTISGSVQKPVTREALMDAIIKIGLPQPQKTTATPIKAEVLQIPSRDRRKNRRLGP